MTPRERVFAALEHRELDHVPRFEVWIDALIRELGYGDQQSAYAGLGQDCIMMPGTVPAGSNAWKNGVDELGRVWQNGFYADGAVDTDDDLREYSPPLDHVDRFFDKGAISETRNTYPDHCLIFGTHIGPFTAGYMAMGFERFFVRLHDDPAFVHRLLHHRTDWCIAVFQKAVSLGAEVIVLGDDVAHRHGPMISPEMWREHLLPYHARIVEELGVPVIWHSDGNIEPLLPMAVEADFVGVHGLEPATGMNLGKVKKDFGKELALVGNINVNLLFGADFEAIRREVDRCLEQGAPGGGYMIATCNSIFDGMNPAAISEMFRYLKSLGG